MCKLNFSRPSSLVIGFFFVLIQYGCGKVKAEDVSPDSTYQTATIRKNSNESKFIVRKWQGVPTIEVLPRGEILVAWYSGGDGEGVGNYVTMARSIDNGLNWEKNYIVVDPPKDCRVFDPCLWYDKASGYVWLYWAQSYKSLWDGLGGVWGIKRRVSFISKGTWSEPQRLTDGVMLNKPILVGKRTFFAVAYWDKIYEPLKLPQKPAMVGANIFIDTLSKVVQIGKIPIEKKVEDLSEHQIVHLKNGKLWALIRTKQGIYESYSADKGISWTQAAPFSGIGPTCTSRFYISKLKSGRLLLIANASKRRNNLTAFISDDDGKTWPYKCVIDTRDGVSYPDAAQTVEGKIYVVYDFNRFSNKEIIMVKLTEDEIIKNQLILTQQIIDK